MNINVEEVLQIHLFWPGIWYYWKWTKEKEVLEGADKDSLSEDVEYSGIELGTKKVLQLSPKIVLVTLSIFAGSWKREGFFMGWLKTCIQNLPYIRQGNQDNIYMPWLEEGRATLASSVLKDHFSFRITVFLLNICHLFSDYLLLMAQIVFVKLINYCVIC